MGTCPTVATHFVCFRRFLSDFPLVARWKIGRIEMVYILRFCWLRCGDVVRIVVTAVIRTEEP